MSLDEFDERSLQLSTISAIDQAAVALHVDIDNFVCRYVC